VETSKLAAGRGEIVGKVAERKKGKRRGSVLRLDSNWPDDPKKGMKVHPGPRMASFGVGVVKRGKNFFWLASASNSGRAGPILSDGGAGNGKVCLLGGGGKTGTYGMCNEERVRGGSSGLKGRPEREVGSKCRKNRNDEKTKFGRAPVKGRWVEAFPVLVDVRD